MNQRKLEILLTNDDGYSAKGINVLADLLLKYGNVTVIAPEKAQSGMSAALSLAYKVRFYKISEYRFMINRLIVLSFIEIKTMWSRRCQAFRHRVPVGRPDLDGSGRPRTCRCQQLACAGGYGVEPYGKNAVHGRCGVCGLLGTAIRT